MGLNLNFPARADPVFWHLVTPTTRPVPPGVRLCVPQDRENRRDSAIHRLKDHANVFETLSDWFLAGL